MKQLATIWSISSDMTNYGWILIVVTLSSFSLTFLLKHYALANHLLDIPNARSSHLIPTPRGGGLAFVMVFICCLPLLYILSLLSNSMLWLLMGACSLVACIGFLDDKYHIPARWRLLIHFLAAGWILFWSNGYPSITLTMFQIPAAIATLGAVFYLVWLLNLYNFMDGINGIAGIEAICVSLSGAIFYILLGYDTLIAPLLLLAASVLGFLFWNFPHAKIFMGDTGSGFLGITLGALSIQAAWVSPSLFVAWLIILGVFIVDATWTLMHRLFRKQRVYEAHRSHTYQIASRAIGKHWPISLSVMVINFVWLLPIAILVIFQVIHAWFGLLLAYLPLASLAYYFKAGASEQND